VHASYVSLCVKTMGVVVLQICWCVRRVRDSVGVCVSVTVCGHLCVSAVCVWSLHGLCVCGPRRDDVIQWASDSVGVCVCVSVYVCGCLYVCGRV